MILGQGLPLVAIGAGLRLQDSLGSCFSVASLPFQETWSPWTSFAATCIIWFSDPFIRTTTLADAERCLAVLTLAFACDPHCRWAWRDPPTVKMTAATRGLTSLLSMWIRFRRPGATDLMAVSYCQTSRNRRAV
jgi:hypothetical protein